MLAVLLALGCVESATTPAAPTAPPVAEAIPTAFDEELAALDERIDWSVQRSQTLGGSWPVLQAAAELHMARARLSGDYADYAAAERLIAEAFALAPEGSGPFLTRAQLSYTLHRLDAMPADLDRAAAKLLQSPAEKAAVALLRANLALQQDRHDDARISYAEALSHDRSLSAVCSLAVFSWKTGDLAQAEILFDEAEGMLVGTDRSRLAWLHLQRGLIDLDYGRLPEAMVHYRAAEAVLPGYWLIEEHIAEVLTLTGQADAALAIYEPVIARTGSPEFMDAVAEILAERGDPTAEEWVTRARRAHDARILDFPEAAAGHALDHYLAHATPEEALALARVNFDARPNTEARIGLVQALLRVGRPDDAAAELAVAEASPWISPDLPEVAAAVAIARGEATAGR